MIVLSNTGMRGVGAGADQFLFSEPEPGDSVFFFWSRSRLKFYRLRYTDNVSKPVTGKKIRNFSLFSDFKKCAIRCAVCS